MSSRYNIVLVDDNPTFLEGLSSMLNRRDDLHIIARYSSGQELLGERVFAAADLILLDIEMPGLNGIQTAKQVNFLFPQIKTIAITMYQDQIYLQQLIEAGFKGFVNKTMVGETLFRVIDDVLQNQFSFPGDIELEK
ncbi:MAG: response regulator transcription factor [Bacteroidales bacterium]|nr:response regulator transcription factor [Bacteroidales bacterium]